MEWLPAARQIAAFITALIWLLAAFIRSNERDKEGARFAALVGLLFIGLSYV